MAHVTGGGINRALKRLLPEGVNAELFKYNIPKIFKLIENKGITRQEMKGIFNMDWGMIMVADEKNVQKVIDQTGGEVMGTMR